MSLIFNKTIMIYKFVRLIICIIPVVFTVILLFDLKRYGERVPSYLIKNGEIDPKAVIKVYPGKHFGFSEKFIFMHKTGANPRVIERMKGIRYEEADLIYSRFHDKEKMLHEIRMPGLEQCLIYFEGDEDYNISLEYIFFNEYCLLRFSH